MTDIKNLKETFNDKNLFEQAMTHRSWVNENADSKGNNERMEFLGDAILEFVVSSELYSKLPNKEEGYLTALRANLVNTKNLAKIARKLDLGAHIKLSKGEEQGGGRENDSLLADTTEALIGAIYLDKGFSKADEFIKTNLLKNLEKMMDKPLKDAKSRLQELAQAKGYKAPRYKVISETGPDHDKEFTVEVSINATAVNKGSGKSKSLAEQAAAEGALSAQAGLVKFEAK